MNTAEVDVLRRVWGGREVGFVPVVWRERDHIVYRARTQWERTSLLANGFRLVDAKMNTFEREDDGTGIAVYVAASIFGAAV